MTNEEIVIDAVAAAKRVLAARNRKHAALLLSTLEMVAMAERVERLEAAAATTFRLLLKIDEIAGLQVAFSGADRARWPALVADVKSLTETLSGALAALGYSQEQDDDSQTKQAAGDRRADPADAPGGDDAAGADR